MKRRIAPLLTALSLFVPAAFAGQAEQIGVVDPYVRMTPPGAKATAAFMQLTNAGEQDAVLVKAESAAVHIAELHNHINDNGVMRMRQVKEIVVPAKGEVALKPGGYHVMLINQKAPMKEGDSVVVRLGFADGSSKEVQALVRRPSSGGMPMMKGMDHSAH